MAKKRILIVGATGMLGNALFSELSKKKNLDVFGTVRFKEEALQLPEKLSDKIIPNTDIENWDSIIRTLSIVQPDIVLNCVGLIKQAMSAKDTPAAIYMNAYFPHRLNNLCQAAGAKMIHFSTDCVFSGAKGMYKESDLPDVSDVYGLTKYLGEVIEGNCLTIRTSIIGHGLETHASLIDWFLSQKGEINGYNKVIYSGLPTIELARILADFVFLNNRLKGLYHVSAEPISKYDLLQLVAKIYHKKIEIVPYDAVVSDRSLDSTRFKKITGYKPPRWEILIKKMYQYYQTNPNFIKF